MYIANSRVSTKIRKKEEEGVRRGMRGRGMRGRGRGRRRRTDMLRRENGII